MQLKESRRNGTLYQYAYVEREKAIIVWKDGVQAYLIEVLWRGSEFFLNCNCPAGKYRHHCYHEDEVLGGFDYNQTFHPRSFLTQITEEFYTGWLKMRREDEIPRNA